jgi:UDP-glucose 4-epimerase
MQVLITGGAGYIGSHCVRCFADRGVSCVVLDDLSDGHKEAVMSRHFVEGDFGDKDLLRRLFAEYRFDAVIHFAAFADVADSVSRPSRYYDNNVTKMLVLLDEMLSAGIKNMVFSSSAATFGEPRYIPIDESHPKQPVNPYGMTKLIGEDILKDYEKAYGIRSCVFRYFNAAGASRDGLIGESHNPEHHLIPLVIRAAKDEKKVLSVFGSEYDTRDGSCLRDYIHVEDLAEAHYLGLSYIIENQCSEDFNLGSDTGFTVLEIIKKFEETTGKKVPFKLSGRRAGDPASLVASNEKARKLLGWELKRSGIETILQDAWNWELGKRY